MHTQIIIAEPTAGSYEVSVSGRFGGGFIGLRTNREAVITRLGLLKSYDCGKTPAVVIAPESLREIVSKVFPQA